ncbi:hypothetical protein A0H81_07562 [Grifola frondosa]|uniref:Uncharacterized protein n=1 Tax=Grifola frondosa TaxID=5627 RepID=A0A1C7M6D7_GRIFR|nr:hypothetical protein A0H81_07562 [Grifola frondosa]
MSYLYIGSKEVSANCVVFGEAANLVLDKLSNGGAEKKVSSPVYGQNLMFGAHEDLRRGRLRVIHQKYLKSSYMDHGNLSMAADFGLFFVFSNHFKALYMLNKDISRLFGSDYVVEPRKDEIITKGKAGYVGETLYGTCDAARKFSIALIYVC